MGTLDTQAATIDWGDGTIEAGEVTVAPIDHLGGASGTIAGGHVYADNGVYIVTVTVTDDDGATTTDTFTITVENAAPTLAAIAGPPLGVRGQTLGFAATFNDLGTLDAHRATRSVDRVGYSRIRTRHFSFDIWRRTNSVYSRLA